MVKDYHYTSCKIYGYVKSVSSYGPSKLKAKDGVVVPMHKGGGMMRSLCNSALSLVSKEEIEMPRASGCRIVVADRGVLKE